MINTDRNIFEKFGVFVESASNSVPKVKTLKKFIDIISAMGYNCMYLGTADTYEIEGEPRFGYNRGRYTHSELKEVDAYAMSKNVELIPAIQTLAHLQFLPQYNTYKDIFDIDNILLCGDEKTYELIEKMFKNIAECYTSRTINIGMDEAFLLGLGKYREKNGIHSGTEIMLKHLNKVLELAEKYNFKCEMWSDMFFRLCNNGNYDLQECNVPISLKESIPKNLYLTYWNYGNVGYNRLNNILSQHKKLSDNIIFAGGIWKWIGVAPDNEYSCRASEVSMKASLDNKINSYIVTLWGDNGGEASLFSVLPGLYFCSQVNQRKATSLDDLDKSEFKSITGVDFDDYMLLDKANKPYDKVYTKLNNKSFFYLYNDIFLGIFDSLITDGIGENFEKVANLLEKVKSKEYGYIFETIKCLCRTLSVKAELGKRAEKYYREKDDIGLAKICESEIPQLIKYLDEFIEKLTYQWSKENKTFGLETQLIRLGGLKQRLMYAGKRFKDYLENKSEKIDEYETEKLPFDYTNWSDELSEDDLIFTRWSQVCADGYL